MWESWPPEALPEQCWHCCSLASVPISCTHIKHCFLQFCSCGSSSFTIGLALDAQLSWGLYTDRSSHLIPFAITAISATIRGACFVLGTRVNPLISEQLLYWWHFIEERVSQLGGKLNLDLQEREFLFFFFSVSFSEPFAAAQAGSAPPFSSHVGSFCYVLHGGNGLADLPVQAGHLVTRNQGSCSPRLGPLPQLPL